MYKPLIISFSSHQSQIKRIRRAVFCLEHNIPESKEFDDQDETAIHALIQHNYEFVATGRMLPDGHIGRIAVLTNHRGKGLGTRVLFGLIEAAKQKGIKKVHLSSLKHAKHFYEKHGFEQHGHPFMEVGIEHINMERTI